MTVATKEFFVGDQKFTPRAATVNGLKGRIWVKRVHADSAWVHQGSAHVRNAASEVEVTADFAAEIDDDSVDAYWDAQ